MCGTRCLTVFVEACDGDDHFEVFPVEEEEAAECACHVDSTAV